MAYSLQKTAERGVAREIGPEHERVDEQSDQTLHLSLCAVGYRRSYTNVLLARVSGEENFECREQKHEHRDSLSPAEGLQRRCHPPRDDDGIGCTDVRVDGGAWPVSWHFNELGTISRSDSFT